MLLVSLAYAVSLEVNPGDDIAGLATSLSPGSEVIFHGGTYELEVPVDIVAVGTESEPIVLRAADGETPVLKYIGLEGGHIFEIDSSAFITVKGITFEGGDEWQTTAYEGVEVSNSTDIVLDGLVVRQTSRTAIGLYSENSRVTVTNCHIYDVFDGAGIYAGNWDGSVWLNGGEISNNWIHDIGIKPESTDDDGISLEVGSNGVEILDNVIYRTSRGGIITRSTEYSPANVIEGNAVWDGNDWGVRVVGAATVRNNVVFRILGEGIYVSNSDRDTLEKVVLSHNTVVDTEQFGIRLEDWAGREGMVLANNLVINPTGLGLYAGEETSVGEENWLTTNIVSGYVEWFPGYTEAITGDVVVAGNGYGDVVDADIWDFYPSDASKVRDLGESSGESWVPDTDFNGTLREGNAPDVGAYEYDGTGNPGWAIQENYKVRQTREADSEEVVGGCCSDKQGSEGAIAFVGVLTLLNRRRRQA